MNHEIEINISALCSTALSLNRFINGNIWHEKQFFTWHNILYLTGDDSKHGGL